MSDLALQWNPALGTGDLALSGLDYVADDGLETAALLSLACDAPAKPGDQLPSAPDDLRGWWADAVPFVDGDQFGSRLWTLARSKNDPNVLALAERIALEALQWMLDDLVAETVTTSASFVDASFKPPASKPAAGLLIAITITRPKSSPRTFRYARLWDAQGAN